MTTSTRPSADRTDPTPVVSPSGTTIDPVLWPDVAHLPPGRMPGAGTVATRIAERLFRSVAGRLAVRVRLPDGTTFGAGGPEDPVMELVRPTHFYRRVGAGGLIGFGESFMAGDWESARLADLLTVFAAQMATLVPPRLQRLRDVVVQHQPSRHRGTASASRRNIAHHYDLSNDLFALFLDPTLTYSSALFEQEPGANRLVPTAGFDELAAAQGRKIDRLLDGAGIGDGSRVLEIGTGWGELALRAARRGAHVTSVTLSEEQQELARRRVSEAGLGASVDIQLCDYRSTTGTYDAVVSVEMIEAVGHEFWPAYFATVDARLRPGGRFGLQAITMPDDRMQASRDTFTWIQKYIFPGGLIPSVESIEGAVREHTSLRVRDRFDFGLHYAHTLHLWRARFESRADEVEQLGFDATFRRMWSLYLAYSEAGFRSGYLDVYQYVFTK